VKVLVAPDSFKGTYTARQVAEAVGHGLADSGTDPVLMPVADGGEGTLDVLAEPLGLRFVPAAARNPWGAACEGAFAVAASDRKRRAHDAGGRAGDRPGTGRLG
jgi:glycerate 2-kinase